MVFQESSAAERSFSGSLLELHSVEIWKARAGTKRGSLNLTPAGLATFEVPQ